MLTREKTMRLIEELDAGLPLKIFSAAQERGETLELMPTVKNWLEELTRLGHNPDDIFSIT